jgi:outer membrane protein assembly factor BamB
MATSTSINQIGNATATFSIGDGPLNSEVNCSATLSVDIDPAGNWSTTISLNWQDPQSSDWLWFYFEGSGTARNTTVTGVGVMDSTRLDSGNILGEWGATGAPGDLGIAASIDWIAVPDGYVGSWIATLNAANIPNALDSNGQDLTVKFVSLNIDVSAGSVQTYHGGFVAGEYLKAHAANFRAAIHHRMKRAKHKPSATAAPPQALPLWSNSSQVMPQTDVSFGLGGVFYAGAEGYFHAADFHTGNPLWTADGNLPDGTPFTPGPLQSPIYTAFGGPGGSVIAPDDSGNLYSIDAIAGYFNWQVVVNADATSLSNPVMAPSYPIGWALPKSGIYITDSQNLYFVLPSGSPISPGESATIQTVYQSLAGLSPQATPVYDPVSNQIVVAEGDGLTAINLLTWQPVWSVSSSTENPVTSPVVAGGLVYIGTSNNTVMAISLEDGSIQATSQQLQGLIELPVAVVANNGAYLVFVATQEGYLYCLDGATLEVQWAPVQPIGGQGQLITAPVVSDGILYVAGDNGTICGFPLAEEGQSAIEFTPGSAIIGLAGVSNGTAYFATEAGIAAANFQIIAKGFLVHCDFIQDFADNTPGTATQVSNYHCHLTLFDANNNPVPGETVQVSSNENVSITVNSTQSYQIGPSSSTPSVNIAADGTGKLVITAQATTNMAPGTSSCLSTPMLTIWASFMGQEEQILVYPDQPLHNKLSTIQGTDLQNATGYPATQGTQGTSLLPSQYQGASNLSNANAVASTVNSLVSGTQNSALMRAAATASPYFAFPASNSAGVTYSAAPSSSYSRPAVLAQPFILSIAKDGATFKTATNDEVQRHIDSLPRTADSIWGDIEDFCDDVVNDVVQVVTLAVQVVSNAIQATIQGLEKAYQFVVGVIQDAVNVIVGVFNSIVKDIELVIQALSYLFDFSDIIATHNQISTFVQNMLGSLQSDIQTNLLTAGSDGKTALQTFFTSIQNDVNSWFGNSVLTNIQSNSLSQAQAPYADPSQAYNQKGQDNNVACTSMSQKANSNMPGASVGSSSSALAAMASLSTAAFDSTSFYSQVATVVEGFITTATAAFSKDLKSEWSTQLTALTNACTSLSTLESQGVSVFVGILQALADLVLDAAEAVVAAFLQMIGGLAGGFLSLITQQITIPVVSDIYQWLTGNPLTLLDLFALLAAIPLTIIYKILAGNAPNLTSNTSDNRLAATDSYNLGQIGYTFAMILYGIMDAGGDFASEADSKALFAAGNVVTSFLVIGFFVLSFSPGLFAQGSWAGNQAYFGVMFFPIVLTMYGLAGPTQSTAAANLSCMYGVIMMLMSIAYAKEDSSSYSDPDGLSLVGNLLGTISPIVKPFSTFDGPTLAIFDIFSDWGSGLVNIVNWQSANS